MENVKEEILKSLRQLFEDYIKDIKAENITYEKIRWELDYIVYPSIGSFLADGSLTKEEGTEIFTYCETKLKELKLKLDMR